MKTEMKPILVVALGGNALLKRGEPLEAAIQRKNIDLAAGGPRRSCPRQPHEIHWAGV